MSAEMKLSALAAQGEQVCRWGQELSLTTAPQGVEMQIEWAALRKQAVEWLSAKHHCCEPTSATLRGSELFQAESIFWAKEYSNEIINSNDISRCAGDPK